MEKFREWLLSADAVVIGAGAGLSASAGFTYAGKRFHENFSDFEDKYGFHDMYSGGFYPYDTMALYLYKPLSGRAYTRVRKSVRNRKRQKLTELSGEWMGKRSLLS